MNAPLRIPEPSEYQSRIFEWVQRGRGNGFVEAVAGSGKTSTIVHCATLLRSPALFLAFNKHIAKELSGRLRSTTVDVKTIHALGMKALRDDLGRKVDVKSDKMRELLKSSIATLVTRGQLGELVVEEKHLEKMRKEKLDRHRGTLAALVNLVDKARIELSDLSFEEDFDRIMATYAIDLHSTLLPYARELGHMAIDMGVRMYQDKGLIDFTDMIWLPAKLSLRPKRYAFVFVDEAQDLSRAQLELALSACGPGGRMLFVGDPRQAIYGFAGADTRSVEKIIDRVTPEVMPLSVCYRCDRKIIALAKVLVPQIEPRPGADPGDVRTSSRSRALREMRDGDLVLCRTTAPLVSACFALIRSGISASVRGRDIGKSLVAVVDQVSRRRGYSFRDFAAHLGEWMTEALAKIAAEDASPAREEALMESISDRYQSIKVVWEASQNLETTQDLIRTIEDLFAVEDPAVSLSTIHRAKGLEADRVYVLRRDLMPHPMAKTDEARKQEANLEYVCYTRAKHELVLIDDDEEDEG